MEYTQHNFEVQTGFSVLKMMDFLSLSPVYANLVSLKRRKFEEKNFTDERIINFTHLLACNPCSIDRIDLPVRALDNPTTGYLSNNPEVKQCVC